MPVALRPGASHHGRRFAVVDVGSNSVRLVVYEGLVRAPLPVFNEKILAGLGRTVAATGRLDPEGEQSALAAVERFVALTRALDADPPEIVATAAVRDAENGAQFVRAMEGRAGLPVRVLRGREEARLSATGVCAAIPEADGLMGDLGGGSLELMVLNHGEPGEGFTFPLGPLLLLGQSRARAVEIVELALAKLPWLWSQVRGGTFYAVGGSWRSFARVDLARRSNALHVVHHHRVDAAEAVGLAEVVAGLSRKSLEGLQGVARRRLESLPLAALILARVLKASGAGSLVFSANGLREGIVHDHLPDAVRRRDPLLEAVERMAARVGVDGIAGKELGRWLAPLFDGDTAAPPRLVAAVCALSEIAWSVHPDYRAEEAMRQILHAPVVGIDHPGRAFVAYAVGRRYGGITSLSLGEAAALLMDEAQLAAANRLGLALRLGHTLGGGGAGVLPAARLVLGVERLRLELQPRAAALAGEKVESRLADLAAAFGRSPELVVDA